MCKEYRRLGVGEGLRGLAEAGANETPSGVGLGVLGVQAYRVLEILQGQGHDLVAQQHPAAGGVGGRVRLEGQGLSVVGQRPGELTEPAADLSAGAVDLRGRPSAVGEVLIQGGRRLGVAAEGQERFRPGVEMYLFSGRLRLWPSSP